MNKRQVLLILGVITSLALAIGLIYNPSSWSDLSLQVIGGIFALQAIHRGQGFYNSINKKTKEFR